MGNIGRNDPCPCGSGKKYKHCCLTGSGQNTLNRQSSATEAATIIEIARARHRAGNLSQAENLYQKALQADPDCAEALHALGLIAHQTGRNDAAIALVRRALERCQSDPAYYTTLGMAYKALNRVDDAIASFQSALAIAPAFAEASYNLGVTLYESGQTAQAVRRFREAVEARPDLAEWHNNLGHARLQQGELSEAISCFRKALAIDPNYAIAQNNMGSALRRQGKSAEAIACYQKAIQLLPNHAPMHHNLGKAFSDFGMLEEAVCSYRAALELDPAFVYALNDLGLALWELGRLDEAEASLRAALALRPGLAQAHFNLHSVLLRPDDAGEAIQCLTRLIDLTPGDTLAHFHLGMLLDYIGDSDAAAPHLEAAAKGSALDRASLDSHRYMKSFDGGHPSMIGSPIQAYQIGVEAANIEGLVMEFGVRFGTSIRQIAALVSQEVTGFDSFEGLPEAWHNEPGGSYSTAGAVPVVPANVVLHKGWFEQTIPVFLQRHHEPVRFMHVDCDLYSSTKTVLECLAERIIPGTVIVFDEYLGHEHWREDEFRAFQEAASKYRWKYDYLCFSVNTRQAVVRIR